MMSFWPNRARIHVRQAEAVADREGARRIHHDPIGSGARRAALPEVGSNN